MKRIRPRVLISIKEKYEKDIANNSNIQLLSKYVDYVDSDEFIDGMILLDSQEAIDSESRCPIITLKDLDIQLNRESFLTSVVTLANFRCLVKDYTYSKLLDFQTCNKYLFMSYNQLLLKKLGQIIANHKEYSISVLLENYELILCDLLRDGITKKGRMNALSHIYGYFRNDVSEVQKENYFTAYDNYVENLEDFSTVIEMLLKFATEFQKEYILKQSILEPYPKILL